MSQRNRIASTGAKHVDYGAVEARIAEQATTVRRLKWTIEFLVLSTVINTATFGGLAHSMMERLKTNEHISAHINAKMGALLSRHPSNTTKCDPDTTDIKERLDSLEWYQNRSHTKTDMQILNIERHIEVHNGSILDNSNILKQLQTDFTALNATFQVPIDRVRADIREVKANISQLESVQASASNIIEVHNESILANNNSLVQLQIDITDLNATVQVAIDRLAQFGVDISEVKANISLHETAIMQIEGYLAEQNMSVQKHRSRIEILESQENKTHDIISNHTAILKGLDTNLEEINVSIENESTVNKAQVGQIRELEMQVNETVKNLEQLAKTQGKVAFSTRLGTSMTNVKIGDIIQFKEVLLNEGSGYNSATGLFTAPTSGVYQLSYFIGHHLNPPGQSWARLMANGTVVNAAAVDAFHNYQDIQGGNVGVARLNAGEMAWIESWKIDNVPFNAGNGFATFSGIFVYE